MLNRKNVAALLGMMVISFTTLTASTDMNVKVNGCKGPVLCSNFPVLGGGESCQRTYHVDAGLLFQQPGFSGMMAGTAYQPLFVQNDTTSTTFANQTVTNLIQCFDYDAGLTVSLGYMTDHDEWLVGARFDWLSSNYTAATYDETDVKYKANPNFDIDVLKGSGFSVTANNWEKIDYYAGFELFSLDVMMSRGAFVSRCYSIEPFAGVKAAWFNTKQVAKYSSTTYFSNGNKAIYDEEFNNWAAGPMFGLNGEYNVTHGIAIFSDNDVAVLLGEAHRVRASTLTRGGSIVITDRTSTDVADYTCQYYVPVRSVIGVKFSRYCLEDEHYIAVKVGYDARAFLTMDGTHSGFNMNGLYLNFIWDF
jgi:hypothetical protein